MPGCRASPPSAVAVPPPREAPPGLGGSPAGADLPARTPAPGERSGTRAARPGPAGGGPRWGGIVRPATSHSRTIARTWSARLFSRVRAEGVPDGFDKLLPDCTVVA